MTLKQFKSMLLLAVAGVCACSNQSVYEAARQNRLQECEQYEGSRREACLAEYQNSYDEYERKRQKALRQDVLNNEE